MSASVRYSPSNTYGCFWPSSFGRQRSYHSGAHASDHCANYSCPGPAGNATRHSSRYSAALELGGQRRLFDVRNIFRHLFGAIRVPAFSKTRCTGGDQKIHNLRAALDHAIVLNHRGLKKLAGCLVIRCAGTFGATDVGICGLLGCSVSGFPGISTWLDGVMTLTSKPQERNFRAKFSGCN